MLSIEFTEKKTFLILVFQIKVTINNLIMLVKFKHTNAEQFNNRKRVK